METQGKKMEEVEEEIRQAMELSEEVLILASKRKATPKVVSMMAIALLNHAESFIMEEDRSKFKARHSLAL